MRSSLARQLLEELYPICRSITGDGVRRSLAILQRHVPIVLHEVASGTRVLDWTVPDEWNIRDAWIKDARGNRIVDFRDSNLHVVSYSEPVRRRVGRDELESHLHSLPEQPDWIPYRTSYYDRTWGFCLSQRQRDQLRDLDYEVCVDSTLQPGGLTYGELHLAGESQQEYIFSCHVCHPSLANDNLSGMAVTTLLAKRLAELSTRFSYRFLFIPGTIGAIAWLARNAELVGQIRGGMTLMCLGDDRPLTYKRSFQGSSDIDRAATQVLQRSAKNRVLDYYPYGYDERQFNSPGYRMPVGALMRGRHGEFDEYHTSADNLDFVSDAQLEGTVDVLAEIVDILEHNGTYRNVFPYGEPQLGRRGIYREMAADNRQMQLAMLWVLSLGDGKHSLLDVSERSAMPFSQVRHAAELLAKHGVVQQQSPEDYPTKADVASAF